MSAGSIVLICLLVLASYIGFTWWCARRYIDGRWSMRRTIFAIFVAALVVMSGIQWAIPPDLRVQAIWGVRS